MPETQALRTKILDYLANEKISQNNLALLIGENRNYLNEVLNGKKTGVRANRMLLTIIRSLGIK